MRRHPRALQRRVTNDTTTIYTLANAFCFLWASKLLCANMDSAVRWLSSLNAITADIPETCSGGSTMAPTPPTLTFYASSELSHFLFHLRILSESESSDSSAIDGAGAVSEDCGGIVPRLTRWLSSTIIGGDGPWFGHG